MPNQQSEIKKSYVNLQSIKKNLPDDQIEEKYVAMFHKEIDHLINLGFSELEEFKIPSEEIAPRVVQYNTISGNTTYSHEKYMDKEMFLMKIYAILSYFEISPSNVEIGFKTD
jgi:hypothetical protein